MKRIVSAIGMHFILYRFRPNLLFHEIIVLKRCGKQPQETKDWNVRV